MDKEQLKQVKEKLNKIQAKIGDGSYIFRGESNSRNDKISSSLYRSYNKIYKDPDLREETFPKNLTAESMQILVLKNVKEYIHAKDSDVLTELQHYGGHTNRIDFSRDYLIALFFACDGDKDLKKRGRLLFLRKNFTEIKEPRKNQNNRVIFQRSVFVEQRSGYIPNEECQKITIPARLKPFVLDYLKQYHGISTETIYGDLPGYIDNQKAYQKAHIYFEKGRNHSEKEEYAEAIDAYGESIKLKSNYIEAYFNRGIAYRKKGGYDDAIVDFNQVIELNQNDVNGYNERSIAYLAKGDYDSAIADCDKAIELKEDDVYAYYLRGLIKAILKDYTGAMADFKTALKLAEQQGNKEFTKLAQEIINKFSTS